MTARFDVEERLTDWLEQVAAPMVPDYLDEVVEHARRTRQRPAWLSPWRWLPMDLTMRAAVVPRAAWLLVILAIVLGLLAGVVVVGSQRHLPPPFGLAKAGLVAFDTNGDVVVANADSTGRRTVTAGPALDQAPMWSPDGTKLAYFSRAGSDSTTSSLIVVDSDGQHQRILDPSVKNVTYPFLAWAPDSRRVAYMGDMGAGGQFTPTAGRIFVADIDKMTAGPIDQAILTAFDPAWSPDGRTIAFGWISPDGGLTETYVMNADGSNPHQISTTPGDPHSFAAPQWSPDGRQILVYGGANNHDVFVIDVAQAAERNLTATPLVDEFYPTWSNAGTRIAYNVPTDTNAVEVHVMNADGSGDRTLATTDVTGSPPSWSPDDTKLLGYDTTHASVVVISVDGSRPPATIPAAGVIAGNWQRLAP